MTQRMSSHACERAHAQVSMRLDGELSAFEDAEVRLHLAACKACEAYEAEVVALSRMVQAAPLETLDTPIVLPRRQRFSLRQAQAAVAAAVVAAVGLGAALGVVRGNLLSTASLSSSAGAPATERTARPAYLDSASYELRLIAQARDAQAQDARRQVQSGGHIAL